MSTELAVHSNVILSMPVSEEMLARFRTYGGLKVEDITDKKTLRVVHERRMELRSARTSLEKARKQMNEDAQNQIKANNAKYKSILEIIVPIEDELKAEEDRVEKAIEDARQAAANKLLQERMQAFKDIGYEIQESVVRAMSADSFDDTLLMARGVVQERARLAEVARQQEEERLRLEQERQAEFERHEAERIRLQREEQERLRVENERLEQERLQRQAEEDALRKAEAERLEKERLAFEEERRKAQEELDRQRAEMAEMIRQQEEEKRKAAEEKRLAEEQELLRQQRERLAAEAAERERLRIEREAEEKRLAEEAAEKARQEAEAERQRLEALKPDLQKIADYIAKLEKVKVPEVSEGATEVLDRVCGVFLGAVVAMNSIIGK